MQILSEQASTKVTFGQMDYLKLLNSLPSDKLYTVNNEVVLIGHVSPANAEVNSCSFVTQILNAV